MAARAVTLVEAGRSLATIVVPVDADPRIREAVADLVRIIARMSGAALPVVEDGALVAGDAQVHVGDTTYARESGLLPHDLPPNGYRIVVSPERERITIVGGGPIGVSHGVYALLSDELGVMWGMPNPLFEEVPVRRTVRIGPRDRTVRPPLAFRVFAGSDPAWNRRNRLDDPERSLPYYGHGHNLCTIVPPDQCVEHPEYCALIDGKRLVPTTVTPASPQPCLTNPDVIRLAIEATRRFLDDNPEHTTFSLCPNDTDQFCQCSACLALDEGMERHRGRRMTSDSYFQFVDEVARQVYRTHPERFIGVYAYWTTELPPRRIAKLSPNVVVYLTQDSSQYHDEAYEARDREILAAWAKVAGHLVIYEYYELGWFLPRYYPTVVARTLSHLPRETVKGFYSQTNAFWALIGPMLYLAARLLSDATLEKDSVLDSWCRSMFWEASGQMKAFYDALERGWMDRKRPGRWFQGFDWVFEQFAQWPADAREEARRSLETAYETARSALVRQRIQYIRDGYRLAYLFPCAQEQIMAIEPEGTDIESQLLAVSATVNETLTAFYAGPGRELLSLYTPMYIEARAFPWWKAYLGDCVETLLTGRPELRERLVAGDATIAELVRIRAEADDDVKMRIGWVHRDMPMPARKGKAV